MKKFLVFITALVVLVTTWYYYDEIKVYFKEIKIPKVIKMGNYNGKDLEWYVLEQGVDTYTLLLTTAVKKFDAYTYSRRGWVDSDIRVWLNEEFLNEAFTEEQQALLEYKKFTGDKADTYDRVYFFDMGYMIDSIPRNYRDCKYDDKYVNWYYEQNLYMARDGKSKYLFNGKNEEMYVRPVIRVNYAQNEQKNYTNVIDKNSLMLQYRLTEAQYNEYSKVVSIIQERTNSRFQRIEEAYNWVFDNYDEIIKEKDSYIVLGFLLTKLGIKNNVVEGEVYDNRYGNMPHGWNELQIDYEGDWGRKYYLDVMCDVASTRRDKKKPAYKYNYTTGLGSYHTSPCSYISLLKELNYNEKFGNFKIAHSANEGLKYQGMDNGLEKYYLNGNVICNDMWGLVFVDGITGTVINHYQNFLTPETNYSTIAKFYYKFMYEGQEYVIRLEHTGVSSNEYIFECTPGYKNLLIYNAYYDYRDRFRITNIFDEDWYAGADGEWYFVR